MDALSWMHRNVEYIFSGQKWVQKGGSRSRMHEGRKLQGKFRRRNVSGAFFMLMGWIGVRL
jgi:hypothetical protein